MIGCDLVDSVDPVAVFCNNSVEMKQHIQSGSLGHLQDNNRSMTMWIECEDHPHCCL